MIVSVEYPQMAIINPIPKSFHELVRDRDYNIPLYQRPYDWDIDKVSDLWDDINKNEPGYFLGIVLFKTDAPEASHSGQFEIVDGQQRLTTLMLLLRAAIELLIDLGSVETASEFQRDYIAHRPAGVKKSRMALVLSRRDKDKFEALLLGKEFTTKRKLSSWKNLDIAIEFFREKFRLLNKEEGQQGIVNFIHNKVLKLSFIEVLLGTDSDVYQFFETLNDRGMDLSIADLVKNRVCGEAKKQSVSVEDIALAIDRISDELRSGKFKAFLLHYCWANVDDGEPVPRKKLMDWYGKNISKVGNVKDFIKDLEKYAIQYYVNYIEPAKCSDSSKRELFTYLDALGATRCYPLLLRAEDSLSTKKEFIRLCKAVEILTFRHTTILQRDAKVLESVFLNLTSDIKKGKSINNILSVLRNQDTMKSDKQFKLAFEEYVPANHKIARYILLKIEDYISGEEQAKLEWNRLTLEHILAEKLDWEDREEYLERLGNLTLLSNKMNSDASNKPFKDKRQKIYKNEKRITITSDLTKYSIFSASEIISRQKDFAQLAVKIWNSSNIL